MRGEDIREAFGATVTFEGPDPDDQAVFFVKRVPDADHQAFMLSVLGGIGNPDRLILHHPSGFALVRLRYGMAKRLQGAPLVETVGAIQFDAERFAAMTGAQLG